MAGCGYVGLVLVLALMALLLLLPALWLLLLRLPTPTTLSAATLLPPRCNGINLPTVIPGTTGTVPTRNVRERLVRKPIGL